MGFNGDIRQALVFVGISTNLFFVNAAAQSNSAPCSNEPYSQFDFWEGEWRVVGSDSKKQAN